jgi:hypothetical protein
MSQIPSSAPIPVCITCGLPTGVPAQLNRLSNGKLCPTCRDRVLDEIPAPFPSHPWTVGDAHKRDVETASRQSDFDGEHRPWPPHGLGR